MAKVNWLLPYDTQEAAEISASRMREVWRKEKGKFTIEQDKDGKWRIYRIYPDAKPAKRPKTGSARLYDRCQKCGCPLPSPVVWKLAFCDQACYENYLDRKNSLAKHKRERAAWEKRQRGK